MTRMRTRIDVMSRMGKVIIAMSKFIVKPKDDCGGEVDYRLIQLEGVEGFDFVTPFIFLRAQINIPFLKMHFDFLLVLMF